MRAVSPSHIPKIISLLGDSLSQGVDIQLKVLQTLLSLLTNYRNVHDDLLGDVRYFELAWFECRLLNTDNSS